MKPAAATLWMGRTRHHRHEPFQRSFSYDVAMISLDVDRLDDAERQSRWFSVGRPNFVSFQPRMCGLGEASGGLRRWAEETLRAHGVTDAAASIHLLTFPRVLGSGFAPISVWVARGADQRLLGVIYEVHNTFGEAHAYVLAADVAEGAHETEKAFHVSPFFDVTGKYRFHLSFSDETFALVVQNLVDGECIHTARLALRARELNDGAVAAWLIRMPFSGFGVILAIHWQALKLWVRGAVYRKKPAQRDRRKTRATPIGPAASAPEETRRSA